SPRELASASGGGTPGKHLQFPGGHRREVTPVPIPNTEVKLSTADGTAWETAWESRSLPDYLSPKAAAPKSRRLFLFPPVYKFPKAMSDDIYPQLTELFRSVF